MIILDTSDEVKNIISLSALLVAIMSAFYSYRNGNIAKKAMKIAEQGFLNKQSSFSLYLIDGFRVVRKNDVFKKILLFHVSINNKSENKNSFKALLEMDFIREDNSIVKIVAQHTLQLKKFIPQKDLTLFDEDIRLDEKNIQSKWLIFEQPTTAVEKYRIDKYTIRSEEVV